MKNTKLTCADVNAKGEIRCPVIEGNEYPGVFLFSFIPPLDRLKEWEMWAGTLKEPERTAKLRAIELVRQSRPY